ncbi:NUDIX domain-containing protein [Pseudomonas sp. CGJS7]|uniref:NUDIX domain-containing protein n=1 Tax=Pseudomonas sp. CGJS7 TaxID=3109348 RepID=UPI003009EA62
MNQIRERHSTVICLQDGKVLMVRKEAPQWSLPGGKIDPGEDHLEAAQRELREETTLPFTNAEFVQHYVFETEEHYLYQMPVPDSVVPHAASEILECQWFWPQEMLKVDVKPTNIALLKNVGLISED